MDEKLWRNENYWVSSFNYVPEAREGLCLPERLRFHDVTLRDGEQTPGVAFRAEEKVRIAKLLDEAGVDRIEVAMPAVSDEDVRATRGVVEMRPKARVFAFSRATESDINLALDCGVDGIILEFPMGEPRMLYELVGIGVGERLEKDPLQDTEYRGVGADADRQGEQRDRREHRRSHQPAYHVPRLHAERSHGPLSDGQAYGDLRNDTLGNGKSSQKF